MKDRRINLIKKETESDLDQEEDLVEEKPEEANEEANEEAVEELDEEVSLEAQVEDLNDKLLRAQAEVQNVRRVAGQEITKARLFGVESLVREFMSVGDNLLRALSSCEEESDNSLIKEGLELTLKSFEGSLETAGVIPINPEGKIFDPEKHEAISVVEDDKKEANTVVEVIQRGFTIQNRILRPAKVVVTKKSEKK